jgi:hypothetical protein
MWNSLARLIRRPQTTLDGEQSRSRLCRLRFEVLEERDVPTVVFNAAFGPDQVIWRPTNTVVTSAVPNNPNALRDPTVYLIFAGQSWNNNNTYPLASAAQTIINSPYLSGLTQYGSDGRAAFGGYAIDSRPSPDLATEVRHFVPTQSTWAQASTQGYTSAPIYVVVYDSGYNGFNEAYKWTTSAGQPTYYNDIAVGDQGNDQTLFTDLFSHELAERISDGTGNGIGVSSPFPDGTSGQIADGEPEGSRYSATLRGTNIVVQAYWSLAQQAFIVPDGNAQTLVLDPIWRGLSYSNYAFTLIQGQLYEVWAGYGSNYNNLLAAGQGSGWLSDTNVVASVMKLTSGAGGSIYDLNTSGQVKVYSVAYGTWVTVSPPGLTATSIASVNQRLYVLGSYYGGPAEVWQYGDSGTLWYDVTPSGFSITQMSAATSVNGLYIVASQNGSPAEVWMYSNSGSLWWRLTGTQTTILQMSTTPDALYILGDNGGLPQVWLYDNFGTNWTPL